MRFLENLVLETPYLFLKKIPYAWIAAVALWAWPPVAAGVFLAIIALGLVTMELQQRFWERKLIRENHKTGRPYRDQPRAPLSYRLRNLALVAAGSAALGVLLNGRLSLTGWQWALLAAGLMLLYRDALVFGASAVYLITERGIGARYIPGHIDYRLFFTYDEIRQARRVSAEEKLPADTFILSPTRERVPGVLLTPRRVPGFSKEIGAVLLTPTDIPAFLARLPANLTAG
jgi:hypothetical protein